MENNLGVRNNNPGNLKDPATGQFRVFSTPQEGQQALVDDLTAKVTGTSHVIKPTASLLDFAKVYAPASDKNNPDSYAKILATNLGVDPSVPISSLSNRVNDFAHAISTAEGTTTIMSDLQQSSPTPTTSAQPTGKLSVQDFGKLIQQKYPTYASQDPTVVGQKTLDKYPQYQSKVEGYTPTPDTPDANGFVNSASLGGTSDISPPPSSDNTIGNTGTTGVTGFLSNILGSTKLGQGLGYAISNATGTQDKVIQAQNQAEEIQGNLIQQIKKDKAQGKDTTRLENALTQLNSDIQSNGSSISDIGTGGITNGQVIGSALQTGATTAGLLSGAGALSSIEGAGTAFSNPVAQGVLKNAAEKAGISVADMTGEEITEALAKGASSATDPVSQKILSDAGQEALKQSMLKNGIGSFSELNPALAKTLGISWKAIEGLAALGGVSQLGKVGSFIKGLL